MHTTKVRIDSVPFGLDKDISKIAANIFSTWKNSVHGQWAEEHAKKIYTEIIVVNEELGMRVEIYADFDHDTVIAHKLAFGNKVFE